MEDHPTSLPEAVLAQLTKAEGETPGQMSSRSAAILTRRSSHSVEMTPRSFVRLRSIEERHAAYSRRSSVVSNVPFSRKNSLCAMGPNKRFSLGPWAHYGRVSFSGLPLYQPIAEIQYENTYKTGPDQDCRFNPSRAQKVLESVLRNYLAGTKYSAVTGGQLAQNLSDLARSKMKEHCPPRYKVVCNVMLGQMGSQGLGVASRALWDPQTDNFASATYSNATLFAVATVHGFYYE
ncbi:PREDICTED: tctex1 domain-containing protein 4 [Nanorana parkeri]|uniref:tctex1 domain-containing protein 4 n=1 Tax=Nanorana parkeri TaxID=125878 RepID=UPI00085508C4|nr:PREDICTED: tctex1 domain-containing protein 4 [Nanorana parkeri]